MSVNAERTKDSSQNNPFPIPSQDFLHLVINTIGNLSKSGGDAQALVRVAQQETLQSSNGTLLPGKER